MSVIFMDGFDHYNSMGPGGRKWDQGSEGFSISPGRFGGRCYQTYGGLTGSYAPAKKTLPVSTSELIVGAALKIDVFPGNGANIGKPIMVFKDGNTAQCSLWVDPGTLTLTVRSGMGTLITDSTLGDTGFVPPLTLWFYIEVKVLVGNPGAVVIHINSTELLNVTGIQTQQSGNNTVNMIEMSAMQAYNGGHYVDDLYIIDTQDATGSVDFLGEVRIQTKYPDADGTQNDFLRSNGSVNASNVNAPVTTYTETGNYNYSGTVGAIDLYSIGNFTVSGTILAVQENLSFRKDDVGNRNICPLLRTSSTNYEGTSVPCFSDYTHTAKIWEADPSTNLPWLLTDLNLAEFGIKVKS